MKSLVLLVGLLVGAQAFAMSDEQYVQEVRARLSPKTLTSLVYGTAMVQVQIKGGKAVLASESPNREFNAVVLEAANSALDGSVADGLVFLVTYQAPQGRVQPRAICPRAQVQF